MIQKKDCILVLPVRDIFKLTNFQILKFKIMKVLHLIFVMMLASITTGFAQNAAANDSIVFNQTVYDYGTIAQGSDGLCEFTFTNKGTKPLTLTNVRAACGCTTPEWPREPIMPGKTGTIKVKYNTHSLGSFFKTITVNSNAVNSRVILRIKGSVANQ